MNPLVKTVKNPRTGPCLPPVGVASVAPSAEELSMWRRLLGPSGAWEGLSLDLAGMSRDALGLTRVDLR